MFTSMVQIRAVWTYWIDRPTYHSVFASRKSPRGGRLESSEIEYNKNRIVKEEDRELSSSVRR